MLECQNVRKATNIYCSIRVACQKYFMLLSKNTFRKQFFLKVAQTDSNRLVALPVEVVPSE